MPWEKPAVYTLLNSLCENNDKHLMPAFLIYTFTSCKPRCRAQRFCASGRLTSALVATTYTYIDTYVDTYLYIDTYVYTYI